MLDRRDAADGAASPERNGAGHEPGDVLEVDLAVTGERWLRALLLRLGTAAEVIEPEQWRGLGAVAAAELLARYRGGVAGD